MSLIPPEKLGGGLPGGHEGWERRLLPFQFGGIPTAARNDGRWVDNGWVAAKLTLLGDISFLPPQKLEWPGGHHWLEWLDLRLQWGVARELWLLRNEGRVDNGWVIAKMALLSDMKLFTVCDDSQLIAWVESRGNYSLVSMAAARATETRAK